MKGCTRRVSHDRDPAPMMKKMIQKLFLAILILPILPLYAQDEGLVFDNYKPFVQIQDDVYSAEELLLDGQRETVLAVYKTYFQENERNVPKLLQGIASVALIPLAKEEVAFLLTETNAILRDSHELAGKNYNLPDLLVTVLRNERPRTAAALELYAQVAQHGPTPIIRVESVLQIRALLTSDGQKGGRTFTKGFARASILPVDTKLDQFDLMVLTGVLYGALEIPSVNPFLELGEELSVEDVERLARVATQNREQHLYDGLPLDIFEMITSVYILSLLNQGERVADDHLSFFPSDFEKIHDITIGGEQAGQLLEILGTLEVPWVVRPLTVAGRIKRREVRRGAILGLLQSPYFEARGETYRTTAEWELRKAMQGEVAYGLQTAGPSGEKLGEQRTPLREPTGMIHETDPNVFEAGFRAVLSMDPFALSAGREYMNASRVAPLVNGLFLGKLSETEKADLLKTFFLLSVDAGRPDILGPLWVLTVQEQRVSTTEVTKLIATNRSAVKALGEMLADPTIWNVKDALFGTSGSVFLTHAAQQLLQIAQMEGEAPIESVLTALKALPKVMANNLLPVDAVVTRLEAWEEAPDTPLNEVRKTRQAKQTHLRSTDQKLTAKRAINFEGRLELVIKGIAKRSARKR